MTRNPLPTMKKLTLLALAGISMLFQSAYADLYQDIRQLVREKRKLIMEVGRTFNKLGLDQDEGYKKLEQEALDASRAYLKAVRTHPKLVEHNKKSDEAQENYIQAKMKKDDEAAKKYMREVTDTQMAKHKAAREIPELVELQKKGTAANNALTEKKIELLRGHEEGKELVGKIQAMEEKIAELQKKHMKETTAE